MATHDVLLIGFDPRTVPGVDATLNTTGENSVDAVLVAGCGTLRS